MSSKKPRSLSDPIIRLQVSKVRVLLVIDHLTSDANARAFSLSSVAELTITMSTRER